MPGRVCPGGGFVVEGVAGQAAVEVADESVAECAEGLVVGLAGGAGQESRHVTAIDEHVKSARDRDVEGSE